ncbi:MAG: hypothetical protein WCQ90_09225 [Deltaproteobacteria bacterium]
MKILCRPLRSTKADKGGQIHYSASRRHVPPVRHPSPSGIYVKFHPARRAWSISGARSAADIKIPSIFCPPLSSEAGG